MNIHHKIRYFFKQLTNRRRFQLAILSALMLASAAGELATIGALFPFLTVLNDSDRLYSMESIRPAIQFFQLNDPSQLLLPVTIFFCACALVAAALRVLQLWIQTRLAQAIGADITVDIYRRILYQSYEFHIERDSSEFITVVTVKANSVIHGIILPCLSLFNSVVVTVAIMATLMYIEPLVALSTFISFGVVYLVTIIFTRSAILINSARVNVEEVQIVRALQEGIGGIRDVLLDSTQEIYCGNFQAIVRSLRRAQANTQIISACPRYVIEAAGMVMIAAIAYTLKTGLDQGGMAIPIMASLALGAQRLLPAMQQGYAAWTSINATQHALDDLRSLLERPFTAATSGCISPISYCSEIYLHNISFRYAPNLPWVLRDLNFSIRRGAKVGFVGVTGGGKSTFLDIFMALLQPTEGGVFVDGTRIVPSNRGSWYRHIAHVPQAIFLSDSTIEENIAFGVPVSTIDLERVRRAANRAQIGRVIEAWPNAYKTRVGERGVRLSGGQRQRIGIARALYKKADVIVLDEATSALDSDTEMDVMSAINALGEDITVLIVAHRRSTLAACDFVIELSNGNAKYVTDSYLFKPE
jgi:ATP-binding cassette subfamily B protein